MGVSAEGMLTMFLRKERFYDYLEELTLVIDGGNAQISRITGAGLHYSDEAAMQFVDDVVDAYNHCPLFEYEPESGLSREAYLEWVGDTLDRRDVSPLLDADQCELVKSLLYCMMRIIADGPYYRYRGTFGELKHECSVLLNSFARGVGKQEFWLKDVERSVLSEGRPYSCADFAADLGNWLYGWKPALGEDGAVSWRDDHPTFFLDDLDMVYEVLGGTHIAESIPAKQRREIMSDANRYAYLKGDSRLLRLSAAEADAAFQQGWLDENDLRHREESIAALHAEQKPAPGLDDGETADADALHEAAEQDVERDVEAWLERFTCKDTWCKRYLALRESYFKLGGIDPLASNSKNQPRRESRAISAKYLEAAIDAVLDQRGISHFTDDACLEACTALRRATARARKTAAQGR